MKVALAIRAIYQGTQLAKVETWKKAGVATTVLTGFLSALVGLAVSFGWLDEVDPQLIMEMSSALVTLVSLALGYLQIATTEKIGLRSARPAGSDGVPEPAAESVPSSAENEPRNHPRASAIDDAFGHWSDGH